MAAGKVFMIDVSHLSKQQKRETESKLSVAALMIMPRINEAETLSSFIATGMNDSCFKTPEDFKFMLDLPDECTVYDITGQHL